MFKLILIKQIIFLKGESNFLLLIVRLSDHKNSKVNRPPQKPVSSIAFGKACCLFLFIPNEILYKNILSTHS